MHFLKVKTGLQEQHNLSTMTTETQKTVKIAIFYALTTGKIFQCMTYPTTTI
jgi:hypothetical protein